MNFLTFPFKSDRLDYEIRFSRDNCDVAFNEIRNKVGKLVFDFFIQYLVLYGFFIFEYKIVCVRSFKINIHNIIQKFPAFISKFDELIEKYSDFNYDITKTDETNFIKIFFFTSILRVFEKKYKSLNSINYFEIIGNDFYEKFLKMNESYKIDSELGISALFNDKKSNKGRNFRFGILLFDHIASLIEC